MTSTKRVTITHQAISRGIKPEDVKNHDEVGPYVVLASPRSLEHRNQYKQDVIAICETYYLAYHFVIECCTNQEFDYYIETFPYIKSRADFPYSY